MNTWIIGMTCFIVGFGIAWLWVYDARRQWVKAKKQVEMESAESKITVGQFVVDINKCLHDIEEWMGVMNTTVASINKTINTLVHQDGKTSPPTPKKAAKR